MTINFNATVVIPAPIESHISVVIEGPIEPYDLSWKIHNEGPEEGDLSTFVRINVTIEDSLLGEESEQLAITLISWEGYIETRNGYLNPSYSPYRMFLPSIEVIKQ